ncbi:MAG: DUF4397 domain-containing protein [Actinomycetota bacterium]
MRTKILAALAATALVLGLVATSVSAGVTDATVFLAHGIPGQKVDVYVSGDELLSNWRYGRVATLEDLAPGVYAVKVRVPSTGRPGALLVAASLELEAGDNVTVVAYPKAGEPFLQEFDNDVTFGDSGDAILQVRHTAKAPKVDVWANGTELTPVDGIVKGDEFVLETAPGVYAYWVSAHNDFVPVIGPAVSELEATHAYQIMAVGTNASNYRFIVIDQDFTPSV